MRLWHQSLIPYLPGRQLLGQHRECCALRGKGWGKNQRTVKYVFNYNLNSLYEYHKLVMQEMKNRGYKPNPLWFSIDYRGKNLGFDNSLTNYISDENKSITYISNNIFNEHNEGYLNECIYNLTTKNEKGKIKKKDWEFFVKGCDSLIR